MLLTELVLDVETKWHRALGLLAVLGMIATESDKLLADWTASIGLAFASLGVLDHPLHLLAGRQRTVGIAALASMDQRLNATLNAQAP